MIIGSLNEARKMPLNHRKKYCLISQTTQNVEEFKKINSYLRDKLSRFNCFNTICDSTDNRQKEVRRMAKNKRCCNYNRRKRQRKFPNRLWEIAKVINPKSYFAENASQLKKSWLRDIEKVAITAGASTPEWVIKKVKKKIISRI